jgi:AcrR family transcriptional regulator
MRVTAEAKSATRERILDAATRLFRGDGWENTTTRGIAQAAGIATGTLFNYFQSKEAIAATLIATALERTHQEFRPEAGASLEEDLFLLIWSGFKSLRKLRKFLSAAAETIFSPLVRQTADNPGDSIRVSHLELLEQVVVAHGVAAPLPAVTVQLYWTLYLGVFSYWAADDSPHQEDTLALLDQSLKLFVASLSLGSKGRENHGRESE